MKQATFATLLAVSLLTASAAMADSAPSPTPAAQPPNEIKAEAREMLRTLIETNTTHGNGSTAAAEILAAKFRAAGFAAEDLALLAPADRPNKGNLVVRYRGAGKARPILFIAHLDVVEAKPEDWTVPPFQLTEKDGYFYGRGTLDMKGDDAALATNLIRLRREGFVPARDVIVAFTEDEEAGDANGVAWLLKNHRDMIDAEMAINPDSGGGMLDGDQRLYQGVETSEKIFVTFGLEVTNKGGHSSLPEPDNAIYRLAAGLGRIASLEFPVRLSATTRAYFAEMSKLEKGPLAADMAAMSRTPLDQAAVKRLKSHLFYNAMLHTTCVATMIDGGHAENALPQRARATIQCRMLPDDSQEAVQQTLAKALRDPAIKISVLTPAVAGPESVLTPAIQGKIKGLINATWPNIPLVPDMDAGASDSKYTRAIGIPSFGVTGMFTDINDNRAHGRDERIGVDAYFEDVEFTYKLIKSLSDV